MKYPIAIFEHEWPSRSQDYRFVAAFLCLEADGVGDIHRLHEHLSIFDLIAFRCELNIRRAKAIMGHMREMGLLEYLDPDGWRGEPMRIRVNWNWIPDSANSAPDENVGQK